MPYQKLVTFYTRKERRMLHAQGIWVDRDGNQIPVRSMNKYRLEKLVRTLATWARKEDNPYRYLSSHPIFIHVMVEIVSSGLSNFDTNLFMTTYGLSVKENRIWQG